MHLNTAPTYFHFPPTGKRKPEDRYDISRYTSIYIFNKQHCYSSCHTCIGMATVLSPLPSGLLIEQASLAEAKSRPASKLWKPLLLFRSARKIHFFIRASLVRAVGTKRLLPGSKRGRRELHVLLLCNFLLQQVLFLTSLYSS